MSTQHSLNIRARHKQQGVALITVLFMLLLMIIIGMAGMRTTTLEEKMSANLRDQNIAFQAAESAIGEAELVVEALVQLSQFNAAGTGGYYKSTDNTDSPWETADWDDTTKAITGTAISGAASAPRYIIEHFTQVDTDADALNMGNYGQDVGAGDYEIFRITALGVGASTTSRAMVQSAYGKRL